MGEVRQVHGSRPGEEKISKNESVVRQAKKITNFIQARKWEIGGGNGACGISQRI